MGDEGAEGAPKGDTITQPRFLVVTRMEVEVIQCAAKRSLGEGVEVDADADADAEAEAEKGCERCSGAFVSPLVEER